METLLRDEVQQLLGEGAVPGCVVAVTTSDRTLAVVALGTASYAASQQVSAESVFHLFSGTKLYTATALMLLVERGDVDLDAPFQHYLPALDLGYPVTVRQLAAHDSGLVDTTRAFLAIHRPDEPTPFTGEALARYRLRRARRRSNGANYRNVNYALLGELISNVAREPYVDFVRSSVLAPLGAEADFAYNRYPTDRHVVGYLPRWSPTRFALPLVLPGASRWLLHEAHGRLLSLRPFQLDSAAIGGLFGTAPGFLPLLREMLSDEDGLLRAASKREMLSVHAVGTAGITSRHGVGLAWKRGDVDSVAFWNHEGGGPGFCTETRLYPSTGLGIVILMNRSQSRRLSVLCHDLCETIRRDIEQ